MPAPYFLANSMGGTRSPETNTFYSSVPRPGAESCRNGFGRATFMCLPCSSVPDSSALRTQELT